MRVYDSGVQPLWISIRNQDQVPYAFLAVSVDQNLFSPLEAAYRNHYRLSFFENERMNAYFLQNAIGQIVPPGKTVSGFVYTNKDLGEKYTQVELVGPKGTKPKLLSFLLPVPGFRARYSAPLINPHYNPKATVSYDEEGLREAIERLPCCTTNADGTVDGDPINIVFVGDRDEIFSAFFDRQWTMAEEVDIGSSWRETEAFLFGTSFLHAPASPLHFYGRRQDVTIQKPRTTIVARNHVRLWRAPMRLKGKPVWVGQVSRDIGVRFTLATGNSSNPPDRSSCGQHEGVCSSRLIWFSPGDKSGLCQRGEPATLASPRKNLTGDPYITDGLRAVLVLRPRL